jgi:hypothetical protein
MKKIPPSAPARRPKAPRRIVSRKRQSLRDIASALTGTAPELPLVHTSKRKLLAEFLKSGVVLPGLCKVFNEPLAYLFYGRPAFRPSTARRPGESIEFCPITFVFKPGAFPRAPKRVFPCDTGAVKNGVFTPHLLPKDRLHLLLGDTIAAARRHVAAFFGSNRSYFLGVAHCPSGPDLDDLGSRYLRLLQQSGPSRGDDRRSAIEVQVPDPIPLSGSLLCAFVPSDYVRDTTLRERLKAEWQCDVEPYSVVFGTSPDEYFPNVRLLTQQLYEKLGFLP